MGADGSREGVQRDLLKVSEGGITNRDINKALKDKDIADIPLAKPEGSGDNKAMIKIGDKEVPVSSLLSKGKIKQLEVDPKKADRITIKIGDVEAPLFGKGLAEGGSLMVPDEGMPVDTYPNIPPEEMDEAMASQLPDEQMEDNYIDFIMDQSISEEDQDYLAEKLEQDSRLSDILDSIIVTASEFSGSGEVEGPGSGVSDSIPARLSDGEFVITKKATDQIGADNLQRMMDDAERAYDGGYQRKAVGGYMYDQDSSEVTSPSSIDEEIKKAMMRSNKIPSLA